MIHRSPFSNSFEFVVIAAKRTQQLQRGCVQRVAGQHKYTTLAQMEIVAGKVARIAAVVESIEADAPVIAGSNGQSAAE
jgi:DNA-directed RNA polymerase omega subunit